MTKATETPERVWFAGDTNEDWKWTQVRVEGDIEYVRKDLADRAVAEARREAWERAIYLAKSEAFERRMAYCVVDALEAEAREG